MAHTLSLSEAVNTLQRGGIVALPTETVIGLACRPDQRQALSRLSQLKGRPDGMAFTIHLADGACWRRWASPSMIADELTQLFWPGPLTLILERRPEIPAWQTADRPTIGLRMPKHALCQAVLEHFPDGLTITSANQHGTPPAHHIAELPLSLLHAIDGVLIGTDNTQAQDAPASTLLHVHPQGVSLLRQGALSPELLRKAMPELAIHLPKR